MTKCRQCQSSFSKYHFFSSISQGLPSQTTAKVLKQKAIKLFLVWALRKCTPRWCPEAVVCGRNYVKRHLKVAWIEDLLYILEEGREDTKWRAYWGKDDGREGEGRYDRLATPRDAPLVLVFPFTFLPFESVLHNDIPFIPFSWMFHWRGDVFKLDSEIMGRK